MHRHDLLLEQAERALEQRALARAGALYESAFQSDAGRSPLPAVGIARVALLGGRYAEAAALLDLVLEAHPGLGLALTIRGVAEEGLGALPAATALHQRASECDPTCAAAWFNLGRTQALAASWRSARASLSRALELWPRKDEISVALAIACLRCGDGGESVRVLATRLLDRDCGLAAHLTLADVLVEVGAPLLAEAVLADSSQRFPGSGWVPAKRAALALRRGDAGAALVQVSRQLELVPEDAEAWLLRSSLTLATLDVEGATTAAHRAIELRPGDGRAQVQVGMICEILGLRDNAAEAYGAAAEKGAADWRTSNALAVFLLEEGTATATEAARRHLEQASRLAPKEARATPLFNLSLAYWKLGDSPASERAAREALNHASGAHPLASEVRRWLGNWATPRGPQSTRR
jgi:tetratricopeptide (TPR) repeat protein